MAIGLLVQAAATPAALGSDSHLLPNSAPAAATSATEDALRFATTEAANASGAEEQAIPLAFRRSTPESLSDLQVMERHLTALVARVSPAVVAVEVGGATGSGVVVSADGLVLSAAHVCGAPNRDARVIFPDGRTARGTTLGTNHELDAGLMRITEAGPWPHVALGDLGDVKRGDWVLAIGHPGGFDRERSLVVRLGRVIRLEPDAVQSDCTLTAGDSGGPLVDMRGRVIGVHSRISEATTENFHVPIAAYRDSWTRLLRGENWGGERPSPRPWIGARGSDHPQGCQIEVITEEGPAAKAGLKPGDIVRGINGQPVEDSSAFRRRVADAKPGDELRLEILRDGQAMSLTVTVGTRRRRP